jgi:hypothetical protein
MNLTKIYIAFNRYTFGVAEIVALGEDLQVFGVECSPVFGNGAIPAFEEFSSNEYVKKFRDAYGLNYELVYVYDGNYPQEYIDVLNRYKATHPEA